MSELSNSQLKVLVNKCGSLAMIPLLYGFYKLYDLGFALEHYPYTYLVIFGALATNAIVPIYAKISGKWSVSKMLGAWSGFIPYFFSLYLMGFLGIYGLWGLTSVFSMWTLIFGVVWILVGYRILYTFWLITEIKEKEPKLT
jgi:hypothetical protein